MKRTSPQLITIALLTLTAACSGNDDDAAILSSGSTGGVAGNGGARPAGGTTSSAGIGANPTSGSGGALIDGGGNGAGGEAAGNAGGGAAGDASASGAGGVAGAGSNASSPGELFGGLKGWKLTLPTGPSNKADEVKQPDLATKVVPGFFELAPTKDRVVMTDLFGGARTSTGTAFARTELREEYTGSDALSNKGWNCTSTKRSMRLRQRITLSPINKPEMSIGQIHDDGDDMLEVRYIGPQDSKGIGTGDGKTDTGKIEAHFNNDSSFESLDPAYQLGQEMLLTISADGAENMVVSYENLATGVKKTAHAAFGDTKLGCYFKAGNYHQACSIEDIHGSTNTECEDKKWADGRYETDPRGSSVLELFELQVE